MIVQPRLIALALLAVSFGCGGRQSQDTPRHVPERFRDLSSPDAQQAPLSGAQESTEVPAPLPGQGLPFHAQGGVVDHGIGTSAGRERVDPAEQARWSLDPGRLVANLELAAPRRRTFVLRATLPVPREYRLPEPGRTNLLVEDRASGLLIAAQIQTVTRSADGRPEVIELLAKVGLATSDNPGRRITYKVILGDEPLRSKPAVAAVARRLLNGQGTRLRLRTRDVYGNVYEADLLGSKEHPGHGSSAWIRSGPAARQRRVYSTLVPVELSGNGLPLPHLMGVHAYLTEWDGDERLSLDLRVNNGASSGSRAPSTLEAPAGIVYWESLELVLPSGWDVLALAPDPFLGETQRSPEQVIVPIVKALPEGRLHMMGPQAQFHRRLTLVSNRSTHGQPEHPAQEGLAFPLAGPALWSWSQPRTPSFLPQKGVIPTWQAYRFEKLRGAPALRARLAAERAHLQSLLRSGQADGNQVVAEVMGWAHPWFVSAQGGTGGVGIAPFQGQRVAAAASLAGYEKLQLLHRMNASRQADTQYDQGGDPLGVHGWLDDRGQIPFDFRTNARMVPHSLRLPAFGGPPSSAQVAAVHARGQRPHYDRGSAHRAGGVLESSDAELLNWMPHDGQHMARYSKFIEALVWLGNDALAKDDLLHAASLFRLEFHGFPHRVESWSEGVTLAVFERMAAQYPHHGLPLDRNHAWGIDLASAAYALSDAPWRRERQSWYERVADLFLAGAMPNGLVQRRHLPSILGGRYDACQTYQVCFLSHAVRCLNESVFAGRDEPRKARLELDQLKLAEYLFLGPVWIRQTREMPGGGREAQAGPHFSFAVAPPEAPSAAPYCDASSWPDHQLPADGRSERIEWWNIWSVLEYAARLDDPSGRQGLDNRFLRRAAAAWTAPGSLGALTELMFQEAARSANDDSGNWAGLVARLQELSQ
ncbi:MAG: hypothetical protein ACI8QC_001139 [Planctomycetota bacterium]|jgi:hypothetical protein